MSDALHANCFDASALLKLYVPEERSKELRTYWHSESTRYTTSLCFNETLTLLKVCRFYRKTIDSADYERATVDLSFWHGAVSKKVPELNFHSPEVFFATQRIAKKHELDLSDAFQIHSVKEGFFSKMCGDSKTLLVTADKELAKAARAEGLRVWNIMEGPAPQS